jgi:hypothetical protein
MANLYDFKSTTEKDSSLTKRKSYREILKYLNIIVEESDTAYIESKTVLKKPKITTTKSSFSTSTSSTESKQQIDFLVKHQEQSRKAADHFLSLLKNDIVDTGYHLNSEIYFKTKLKENPSFAKEWLNTVFLENYSNVDLLVKILYIISDIDYDLIVPQGPTIAMAASRHENAEVKEYAVRVFESWENPHMLKYLKYIKFDEEWLQTYLEQVIRDLEEE